MDVALTNIIHTSFPSTSLLLLLLHIPPLLFFEVSFLESKLGKRHGFTKADYLPVHLINCENDWGKAIVWKVDMQFVEVVDMYAACKWTIREREKEVDINDG